MENYELKELKHKDLCYEWEIKVPAADILKQLEDDLTEKQKSFKMAGYRDGKVPMQMVRKQVGPEILSSLIEQKVDDTVKDILDSRSIRAALQPLVEIKSFGEKEDLVFVAKVEYIENVPAVDWSKISLDVIVVEAVQDDMDRALSEIQQKFKMFKDADAKYVAKKGDAVLVDFHGKIADKDFDGNKGEDVRIELGSDQFIPGFEAQLVGAKAGISLTVRVTFPKNYSDKAVAGKPAVFEVKVKKVMVPESVNEIDDKFAHELGLESKEKLLEMIHDKISSDLNGLARLYMKKVLFDKIDEVYRFDIPNGMVEMDFQAMWNDVEARRKSEPGAFKGRTEAELKAEYTDIARRRVRLGIILAELSKEHGIEVTEADLRQAMFAEAMMRPGQESMVIDYYSKPENLERLKGPILEEKAVDHILSQINKNEIKVTSQEFFEKYAPHLNVPTNGM